jgi:hypothetical protein
MLRRAMASRVEIDLASYDRLFPSQDTVPTGSFGNLIALPLDGQARRGGTTVFSIRRRWSRTRISGRSCRRCRV